MAPKMCEMYSEISAQLFAADAPVLPGAGDPADIPVPTRRCAPAALCPWLRARRSCAQGLR